MSALTVAFEDHLDRPRSADAAAWIDVCAVDDILPDSGVCALVAGRQIAVVRFGGGAELYALDNFDPFSRAPVIARGIVGEHDGIPKIASPIYKQTFDLRTGRCFEDPDVSLSIFPVRVRDGRVELLSDPCPMTSPE